MRVDAHVACRSRQTLVLPVGNVLVGLRVNVLLGQAKVDDVDGVLVFAGLPSDEKILRFDVTVDQVLTMYIFYSVELWKGIGYYRWSKREEITFQFFEMLEKVPGSDIC